MKLLEPRRKRRVTAVPRPPFPIQIESETGIPASRALWQVYTGIFNGDCVVVDEPHEMDIIFNMGFFGKGSLSRGGPEFGKVKKGLPPYLKNRQWLRRKEWAEEQEKIQMATGNESVSKDQAQKDSENSNKCAEESEVPLEELVVPVKSDDITIVTPGPSGNISQATESTKKEESLQDEVITVEVSDLKTVKTDTKTDQISSVSKELLKEMDVVVLSDDEAPKRRPNGVRAREEIEVIEDSSSNDVVSKMEVLTDCSNTESASANKSKSAVCRVETLEAEANKQDVGSAEEVIEIVDSSMDVDVPAVTSCSDSKDEEVECVVPGSEEGKDGRKSVDVVMVQDNSSRSGADVVMVEDAENSCGAGMIAGHVVDKDDDCESEEGDEEQQCRSTGRDNLGCQVLVLPDSDSEDEGYKNYVKNLHARLEWEQFPVREALHLSLEEAYFLSYGLGCLQVLDPFGDALSLVDLWKVFRDAQKDFVPKYVAYHYLRAKGWVVRSGLKYGGDFMLYKQGPVFYHASYVVIVEVLQAEDWSRHPTLNSRSFSWGSMTTLNRVVTAAGKELLLCQVIWPTGLPSTGPDSPASFSQFAVNEVLMRRWVASEEREKDEENVDWDGQ